MKSICTFFVCLCILSVQAQDSTVKPIEATHSGNNSWTIVWVLVALAVGIGAYMLIKKNPRKDAY